MRQRLFSIQRHSLLVYFDEAFVFHVSQFPGNSRAVGTEIVGQLGPGQGMVKVWLPACSDWNEK